MTQTCVVLADAELVKREDLEDIAGQTFSSEKKLRSMFNSELLIYPLWGFTDAVNDNELDILTGYYITYIQLKL